MTDKSIPELSVDTRLLYQRLKDVEVGDTVSYNELCGVISRDVQKEARHLMMSAVDLALKWDHAVFACVRRVGLKRLADREVVSVGEGTMGRLRRASRRTIRKLAAVRDFSSLTREERTRHNAYISMFGVISHLAQPKQIEAVQKKMGEGVDVLPLMKTLEAFQQKP